MTGGNITRRGGDSNRKVSLIVMTFHGSPPDRGLLMLYLFRIHVLDGFIFFIPENSLNDCLTFPQC